MRCSSQPNREFARALTRIFIWRQSFRVGVRADGTDLYGKSELLQGARGGHRRRRVPAAAELGRRILAGECDEGLGRSFFDFICQCGIVRNSVDMVALRFDDRYMRILVRD